MLSNETIQVLESSGFKVRHAMVEFSNGKTLFKGLFDIEYKGVKIGSIRENNGLYTFNDVFLYRPIGKIETKNIEMDELKYILENIKYYHFNTNLSELSLNKIQSSIVNTFLRRAKRGADVTALNNHKNKLHETWKNNSVMSKFINQIDILHLFESVNNGAINNEFKKLIG